MSKFFTAIPVDINTVAKLLPPGAFIEAIRWNPRANQVEIVWDHAPFYTGMDFAGDFAVEHLHAGTVPSYVNARQRAVKLREELQNGNGKPADARTPILKGVARSKPRARRSS